MSKSLIIDNYLTGIRITASPMWKSEPDQWKGESFQHNTENEQVERGLIRIPDDQLYIVTPLMP